MVNVPYYLPAKARHGKCRVVPFEGKRGMANAGQYVPGNGRDGKCKVVTFRKREAR